MEYEKLVRKNRSYRRFDARRGVSEKTLLELVELARLTPSAANKQPLKYLLSCTPETNEKIFETLAWAAYLPDWPGPDPGERPTAYIVILLDKRISESAGMDCGIAAQTILLGAADRGLGGCMIMNVRKNNLKESLTIDENLEVLLVIALGVPVEEVVIEEMPEEGSVKYYRDENMVHHVPKRSLKQIIIRPGN